jgi:WD40 repeat protein
MATCDAIEAPEKGTDKTMRAKMRDARVAELAKDFPRAQSLYLEAWAQQHTPRALEAAARVAALGGDLPTSRRLLGRTLTLAETGASQVAHLTSIPEVTRGGPHLSGDELTLAMGARVVAHDMKSGDARVLLDTTNGATTLSTAGTFAVTHTSHLSDQGLPYRDPTANVYDLLTGTLALKVDDVDLWAFSPDDTLFAAASMEPSLAFGVPRNGHIRVLDTLTGDVLATVTFGPILGLSFVGFAPDRNHLIAVGGHAGGATHPDTVVMRTWDVTTKAQLGSDFNMSDGSIGAVGTSRDGRWLVFRRGVAAGASSVQVRDMVAGKITATLPGRFWNVTGYAISEDGKTVATGSSGSLRLWDVAKQKQTFVERDERSFDDPHLFAFSDDGTALVRDGWTAQSWDVATGKTTALPLSTRLSIENASWSPDGSTAAILTPSDVRILSASAADPRLVCETDKHQMQRPVAIAFSHDSKSFACATDDGRVRIYDTATWTERTAAKGIVFTSDVTVDLGFGQDDKAITALVGRELRRFDAQTGAELAKVTLKHPNKKAFTERHALFSDGSLALWLAQGASLFDATGAYVRDVTLPAPALTSAFSRDGKAYVSVSATGIDIVDLATAAIRNVPFTTKAKSASVAISGDDRSIAVLANDGVVTTITGSDVHTLDQVRASHVWFAGRSLALLSSNAIALRRSDEPVVTLDFQSSGILASLSTGAFETRGKPEIVCVVGTTTLERGACAEREREDVVAAWLDRARP